MQRTTRRATVAGHLKGAALLVGWGIAWLLVGVTVFLWRIRYYLLTTMVASILALLGVFYFLDVNIAISQGETTPRHEVGSIASSVLVSLLIATPLSIVISLVARRRSLPRLRALLRAELGLLRGGIEQMTRQVRHLLKGSHSILQAYRKATMLRGDLLERRWTLVGNLLLELGSAEAKWLEEYRRVQGETIPALVEQRAHATYDEKHCEESVMTAGLRAQQERLLALEASLGGTWRPAWLQRWLDEGRTLLRAP